MRLKNGYKSVKNPATIKAQIEKLKSRKSFPNDTLPNLLNLCSWGYIEMFFPNMQDYITKIAKKVEPDVSIEEV